jgi:hypothetical protein
MSASLAAWYDFSDESSVTYTAGEGGVTAVADKAPIGFNARKSIAYDLTAANGGGGGAPVNPTYGATTLNGLNLMEFTSKSYLDLMDTTMNLENAGANQGNVLVVFVSRIDGAGTTSMTASSLVSMADSTTGWQLEHGASAGVYEGRILGNGTATTVDGDHPNWSVWSVVFDWANTRKRLYNNGVQVGADGAYTPILDQGSPGQRLRINTSRSANAWPNSSHGEMIVGLNPELREAAEGYLAHKWALAADLPAGHLYKTAAPTV